MRPFIIAEVSANHGGSIERAFDIIDAAAEAGVDAIKFQTFTPEQMAVPYKIKTGPWAGRDMVDLYKEAQTPREWHERLFHHVRAWNLIPLSSPFSIEDVDFLEDLDCPMYKIASFELVDLPLVTKAAQTGKPLILSTGQAELHEIRAAVNTARQNGCKDLTLLHCISEYPTPMDQVNLNTMEGLRRFGCKVGISDHTLGTTIPIAATALGAEVIEKHITIGKGLDSAFSLNPDEFKAMVTACRDVSQALGKIQYYAKGGKESLRRSLYYTQNLKAGTILENHHIKTARPNLGLSPLKLHQVIGKPLTQDVELNDPVQIM